LWSHSQSVFSQIACKDGSAARQSPCSSLPSSFLFLLPLSQPSMLGQYKPCTLWTVLHKTGLWECRPVQPDLDWPAMHWSTCQHSIWSTMWRSPCQDSYNWAWLDLSKVWARPDSISARFQLVLILTMSDSSSAQFRLIQAGSGLGQAGSSPPPLSFSS
jgi:hypothetical protein